jgi:adenylate cyclase
MTGQGPWRHDRGMDLPTFIAWLVDAAGASPGPDRFLAELGGWLLADGPPLAGGALTLAVPHPIIARRAWVWRAETGAGVQDPRRLARQGVPGLERRRETRHVAIGCKWH